MSTEYILTVERKNISLPISLTANDGVHAQAQAADISNALKADTFSLNYEKGETTTLSDLFRRLAFSDFPRKACYIWNGGFTNTSPVIYALGKRYYVRPLIMNYLQVGDDVYAHNSCNRKNCINPFHNSYKIFKAAKLTSADTALALAFASSGAPVKEIAKALKVHRSTIYRILRNEHLHSRPSGDRQPS